MDTTITLTAKQSHDVQALATMGYGDTVEDVIIYLMQREIDDLKRSGVLEK
jgi:hypothetical protein